MDQNVNPIKQSTSGVFNFVRARATKM